MTTVPPLVITKPDSVEEAILQAHAVGFLLDWLRAESFKTPCTIFDLEKIPELERFFESDPESIKFRNQVLRWLQDKGFLKYEPKQRPGRPRKKAYTAEEIKRAQDVLRGDWEGWAPETVRRSRAVLGRHKPSEKRYDLVPESIFPLLEQIYGYPNGSTASEFAKSHGLPTKLAKAYVRYLQKKEVIRIAKVNGREVAKVICKT